jgi:rubrerythrin
MSLDSATNASTLNANERERVLHILQSNWQAEMRGCHTYELWAERETEPQRRSAFRTLAKAEKHHADLWAERIHVLGGPEPTYHGPATGQTDTVANRVGGVGLALRRLELPKDI